MDEVENPSLPAAGESSPTLRPIEQDEDSAVGVERPHDSPIDTAEADAIVENTNPKSPSSPNRIQLPARPALKRETSNPPPPQPPPAPPEANEFPNEPPDSLTLADLKRIRSTFPNAQVPQKQQLLGEDKVYDFEYQDAQSLPVELEEWFSYADEEQVRLRRCKSAFNDEWRRSEAGKSDWLDVTEDVRRTFVTQKVEYLAEHSTDEDAATVLHTLTYIGLGVWEETGGRQSGCKLGDLFPDSDRGGSRLDEYRSSTLQLQWIVAMVDTLHACDGLRIIYNTLRTLCEEDLKPALVDQPSRDDSRSQRAEESTELWCCLTLMYLFIEVARTTGGENGQKLKKDIVALEPSLLHYFIQIVAKMRWEESAPVPLTKMLLLSWKTILVTLGGINDIERVKTSVREEPKETDAGGQPVITASPLDYHLFRQEISSKYPAYQPPPPLFPLEPENNSILPPLKHRCPNFEVADTAFTGAPSVGTESIMHQPVHIATPAPSPPPSPAGPGKAGKKQNYQTNQMFPFLYPPLGVGSNDLGGKGSTELQDALVGRKWGGSDIPTSILEAAELFAQRMRATRAMKQLWEVRVDYMKEERGWKAATDSDDDAEDFEVIDKIAPEETAEQGEPLRQTDEQRSLAVVGNLYHECLPNLQSFVLTLFKSVYSHVSLQGQNGLQPPLQTSKEMPNDINGSGKVMENGNNLEGYESTTEELEKQRSHEITCKAVSAILILLLKWFKVSHILQYEYLAQLLVDASYVQLTLRLWQTQDIGRSCHYRLEKDELNFFHFCRENSRKGLPKPKDSTAAGEEESEDEALPPSIKLQRSPPENPVSPTSSPSSFHHPPEVDELGYPKPPSPPPR